jgi:hypothetical protein
VQNYALPSTRRQAPGGRSRGVLCGLGATHVGRVRARVMETSGALCSYPRAIRPRPSATGTTLAGANSPALPPARTSVLLLLICMIARPRLAMQHAPRSKIRNLAYLTRCALARFSKAKSDVVASAGDAGSSSQGKIERFRSVTGLNKHCCSPASASSLFLSHAIANGRDFRRRRVARLGVAGAVIVTTPAPQRLHEVMRAPTAPSETAPSTAGGTAMPSV